MVSTSKTKKRNRIFKNTKRTLRLKRNQIGGDTIVESITPDEYERRLGINDNDTYLKTILQHHFNNFDKHIIVKNKKEPKQVTINEPLIHIEGFFKKYNEVFNLINQEYKFINFKFTYDNKTISTKHKWDAFKTEEEFIDVYEKDIGRNVYITKDYKHEFFEGTKKDGKSNKEILTKDKHCIDCSEEFIKQINTENSKIRNGFKLLITQDIPLNILYPFKKYDQIITNQGSIIRFSYVLIIINNCIFKIIFFGDLFNQSKESAQFGYIIIKYDPYNNHNLSMMYYSTNNYFDNVNLHIINNYPIFNSIIDSRSIIDRNIFKKKILIQIKDIIINHNLTIDENILNNNKNKILKNKLYKYKEKLLKQYYTIYFLKV